MIGSKMFGYYGEAAYSFDLKGVQKLTPFIRYEAYNTHAQTEGSLVANPAYDRNELTFGLDYKVANGVAFKVDSRSTRSIKTQFGSKHDARQIPTWF